MSSGWPGSSLQKTPTNTEAVRVDLNADIGESFGVYRTGSDEMLMRSITSGSIACGFHAGDPSVMRHTVRLAARAGVAVGAHPAFPDLVGFGRRDIEADPQGKTAAHSRKVLGEAIGASAEVFKAKPFFLSDEFSLVDASIAPILWRLQSYGIELPPQAQPITKYMNSIFARSTFRSCLTEAERGMRH